MSRNTQIHRFHVHRRAAGAALGLLLPWLLPAVLHAQGTARLSGQIRDTSEGRPLAQASILLMRASDSTLLRSVRTGTDGRFCLTGVAEGRYLLMATYPKYADYLDTLSLTGGDHELPPIPLTSKAVVLQEVIVRQSAWSFRIKGDTTEYRADSFHVAPNADVQQLLKRLPGIQVNSRGEITAQGERVSQVLVDGEEFFSDDPAVVTRNLRADIVDKVQVFDKKSDQAAFTGIDDGETRKTINLTLKEDKKNGYFGRLEGGTDFGRFRNAKALGNLFKGSRKLAGYATTENARYEALDMQDEQNFSDGGGGAMVVDEEGNLSYEYGEAADADLQSGLPSQQTAGLMFQQKLRSGDVVSNLQYQRLATEQQGSRITRTLLKDGVQLNRSDRDIVLDRNRVKAKTGFEWGNDSTGLLKLNAKGGMTRNQGSALYVGQTSREDGQAINNSTRTLARNGTANDFGTDMHYRRRLAKPGRTFSWSASAKAIENAEEGSLRNENRFFTTAGQPPLRENIDQRRQADAQALNTASSLVFTEPLGRRSALLFKYGLGISGNDAQQASYERDPLGAYNRRVDSLSNHFRFRTLDNSGALTYRYTRDKFNILVSTGIGNTVYRRKDIDRQAASEVGFLNFLPSAKLTYKPKAQRRISLDYNGAPVNPTLQQLQPIVTNTDPLNLLVGNPDLVQGYAHTLKGSLQDSKTRNNRMLLLNGSLSLIEREITQGSRVDALGRTTTQYLNTDGNYLYTAELVYNVNVRPDLSIGAWLGIWTNRYVNLVNGERNATLNRRISYTLRADSWSEGWLSYSVTASARRIHAVSSLNASQTVSYWRGEFTGEATISLPAIKARINLPMEFFLFQRTPVFNERRNIWRISPTLHKTLTRNERLEAKLSVFDLLNQNRYVYRDVKTNFITEDTQNGIRRNIMLSLLFHFNRTHEPTP